MGGGHVLILLLVTVFTAFLPACFAVRCYVCSWSPEDADNRTDFCSADHFESRISYIHECELGCETYVQWDKNEVLEHWRRNCIQPNTPMTGDCVTEDSRGWMSRRCTCDADYCNSAVSLNFSSEFPAIILTVSFLIYMLL